MLISFAIHPEKALKPVNRRKSTSHNLNIPERRDSLILVPVHSSCAVTVDASFPADTVRMLMGVGWGIIF